MVKTQPQKESLAQFSLRNARVEVFYPKILVRRRGRRLLEPLFPTYLFCHLDPTSPFWPMVRWATGVAYFLGSDGKPVPVPDNLVDGIRKRVAWWNAEGHRAVFSPGQRVRVTRGPMAGLEAVFEGYVPARQRCRILLQVVGRLSRVEIPETDLESLQGELSRFSSGEAGSS